LSNGSKNLKTYEGFSTLLIFAMIATLLLFLRGLFKDLKRKRTPSKLFNILNDVSHLMKSGELDPTLNHFQDRYTIDIIYGDVDKTILFIKFNEDETELYFNIQYPSGNSAEIEVDLENQTFEFNLEQYEISDRMLRNIKKQLNSIKKQF